MKEGILAAFLKRNGGDIVSFLFEALTREQCEAIREKDGYIRGLEEGKQQGLADGRKEGEKLGIVKGSFETFGKMVDKGLLSLDQAAEQLEDQKNEFIAWYEKHHKICST